MKLLFILAFLTLFLFLLCGQEPAGSLRSVSSYETQIASTDTAGLEGRYIDTLKYYNHSLNNLKEQLVKQEVCFWYERVFSFLLVASLGVFFLFYLRKEKQDKETKQIELLAEIENLKKQQATWSVSAAPVSKAIALDKAKIERAISSKLGESSWLILNVLLQQPAVSNKTIAQEVSLSVEGVSSSLRRMYTSFDVKASHNKKVALITKAVRISIEKEEEA